MFTSVKERPPQNENSLWSITAAIIFLLGGFLGIVGWLHAVDVYHLHFFQSGFDIFLYNFFRSIFVFFLIWLIYAVGYFALLPFVSTKTLNEFTFTERIIIGFSIGVGIWHIVLFVLGVVNLYYRSVMLVLCSLVLLASAKLFLQMKREAKESVTSLIKEWQQGSPQQGITALLVGMSLIWLLMVRGLYPGGGGDYFTHYFYYYLDVIQNHGLVPNDVWYHYYYSKGAGYLSWHVIDRS